MRIVLNEGDGYQEAAEGNKDERREKRVKGGSVGNAQDLMDEIRKY